MSAEAIAKALGGAQRAGRGWLALCPVHDNRRTPALSLADGDNGRLLAHCFAGCGYDAIRAALADRGLVEDRTPIGGPARGDGLRANYSRGSKSSTIAAARRIWEDSRPASDTLAETYLRNRGILCTPPDTLRFHSSLKHPSGKSLPAMVAAIHRDGAPDVQGVHRTWLAFPGRKADATPNKAMLGACRGGAVRLGGGGNALLVAEGIETALSLRQALGDDAEVWAALSTSGVRSLELPPIERFPEGLVVAPDGDAPGFAAAHDLAGRATALGWQVRIMRPELGTDWNDVAMEARHV